MVWTRALIGFCSLLVVGCVSPETYRVLKEGETYRIYQPNTRALKDAGSFSVDVLDVLPFNNDCRGQFEVDDLSVRRVSVVVQGRSQWALRFTRTTKPGGHPVEDRNNLESALVTWWVKFGENNPQCFSAATRESIIRSVMAQRPMTPEEAIADWYGPGPLPGEYRAIVLRQGMRVCVSDVMPLGEEQAALDRLNDLLERIEDAVAKMEGRPVAPTPARADRPAQSELAYRLAGSSCARLVDGIHGPTFDPVASWLRPGLKTLTNAPSNRAGRSITSWPEIEPLPWQRSAFMVIEPVAMPALPPEPDSKPNYGLYSILVIANLDAMIPVSPAFGDPIDTPAVEAVRQATLSKTIGTLCSDQGRAIRCLQFGERGVFSADFSVQVNGQLLDVPVGATLESLLSLIAPDFLAQDFNRGEVGRSKDPAADMRRARLLQKLRMRRWFEGRQVPVRLDPWAAFLPLQPGDEIQW